MAINRGQKETLVQGLAKDFSESQATFVVGVKGITVEKLESLRKLLRKEGGSLKVAKVRLMKRALDQVQSLKGLESFLTRQVAVVFASKEPSVVAKCLYTFSKDNEAFSLEAGYMDAAFLGKEAIRAVAMLPSRDILIGQLIATMMAPMTSMVVILKALEEQKNK